MASGVPLLVLASGSPRRRELLAQLGVPFEVRVADVDESPRPGELADDLVRRLAAAKAQAVLAVAPEAEVVVLAADTVVVLDGVVFGKPVNAEDATRMLRLLSGRTHTVLTGVAVARRDAAMVVEAEATEVTFVELTAADIATYVATGEPLDKAGAYGIQGAAGGFVAEIVGNKDNVIGLGQATTTRLLTEVVADKTKWTA